MTPRPQGSTRRAGVAFDGEAVVLALRDGAVVERRCDSIDALASVLGALLQEHPGLDALGIVIARPLAHLCTIAMPAMSREDGERVLARDWERHVIGVGPGAMSVAAERLDAGGWRAAFVPSDVVEQVAAVAADAGIAALSIATADDILAAAGGGRGDAIIVLRDAGGAVSATHARDGRAHAGRALPTGDADAALARFAAGCGSVRAPVRFVDARAGRSALATLASAAADAVPTLPVRSRSMQARARTRSSWATRWLMAATIAALVVAPLVQRWRVDRALASVAAERRALAMQVAPALAARDSLALLQDVAVALAEREASASRVAGGLAAIALALPGGTTLSSLTVTGDSIAVEGESPRSATVYEALRRAPALGDVRLAAPLRQEVRSGAEGTVERFAFTARLRSVR